MIITDYDTAHAIVSSNKSLSWDGWDIVDFKKSDDAEYNVSGKNVNGAWGYVKVYPLSENGWELPKRYAR